MFDRMREFNPGWIDENELNVYKRIFEVLRVRYGIQQLKGLRKGYRVSKKLLQKMYLDIIQKPRGFTIHPLQFCYSEGVQSLDTLRLLEAITSTQFE